MRGCGAATRTELWNENQRKTDESSQNNTNREKVDGGVTRRLRWARATRPNKWNGATPKAGVAPNRDPYPVSERQPAAGATNALSP